MWLTAAGNASKATDAKNKIQNAVIGAILLFASYLILYIINPDLVKNTLNFSLPRSSTTSLPGYEARTGLTDGSAELNGCIGCLGQVASKTGVPVAQAQTGIYFFTIRVTDANGDRYDQDYSMEVLEGVSVNGGEQKRPLAGRALYDTRIARAAETGLQISTRTVPDGVNGRPYFAEIVAVGGRTPYVYEVVANGGNNGLPEGVYLQSTAETPILTIENMTAQRSPSYIYYQTDRFKLTLRNAKPNSTLFYKWEKNSRPWFYPGKTPDANGWINFGQTDTSGRWVNEANFTSNEIGRWYEWAMVDGKISNAIGFEVASPGSGGAPGACSATPPSGSCPSGTRWACLMTSQNPPVPLCSPTGSLVGAVPGTPPPLTNVCEGWGTGPGQTNFSQEWTRCRDVLFGGGDLSNLPACSSCGLNPGDPCRATGTLVNGQPYVTNRCSYRDQAQAIRCGAPASGDYCLPGYTNQGCLDQSSGVVNGVCSGGGGGGGNCNLGGVHGECSGSGAGAVCTIDVPNTGTNCTSECSINVQCQTVPTPTPSCDPNGTHFACAGSSCSEVQNTATSCTSSCSGNYQCQAAPTPTPSGCDPSGEHGECSGSGAGATCTIVQNTATDCTSECSYNAQCQ